MNRREFFRNSFGLLALATVLPLVGRRHTPMLDKMRRLWFAFYDSTKAWPGAIYLSKRDFRRYESELPQMARFSRGEEFESITGKRTLLFKDTTVFEHPFYEPNGYQINGYNTRGFVVQFGEFDQEGIYLSRRPHA